MFKKIVANCLLACTHTHIQVYKRLAMRLMWAWHLPSHHINQTCAAAAIAATAAAAVGIDCEQEMLIKNFFKRIMNKLLNIAHIF